VPSAFLESGGKKQATCFLMSDYIQHREIAYIFQEMLERHIGSDKYAPKCRPCACVHVFLGNVSGDEDQEGTDIH